LDFCVALAAFGAEVRVVAPVYLDEINDFAKMTRVYAQYFPEIKPSRTTAAQVPPRQDRGPVKGDTYPSLEQISLIAVR
jgi:enamine deaminase RidA (YjgF/YER057c/UK114 family)